VHPNVFHSVLDEVPVSGWQVIHERDSLNILLAGAGAAVDEDTVRVDIEVALRSVGVHHYQVRVAKVDTIPRTALGKAPLVRQTPA